jgi:hypothetical protein
MKRRSKHMARAARHHMGSQCPHSSSRCLGFKVKVPGVAQDRSHYACKGSCAPKDPPLHFGEAHHHHLQPGGCAMRLTAAASLYGAFLA